MNSDDLPPLKYDAVEPVDPGRRKNETARRTTLWSLIGVSLFSIYAGILAISVFQFFSGYWITDPRIGELFAFLGLGSLVLLLLWISFSFRRYPEFATVALRVISVSIVLYLLMSLPSITS